MVYRIFPALMFLVCLVGPAGCDDEAPSQQAVQAAWRRADQAIQQSAAAQADVKHIARLRDLDRLRHEADVGELSTQISTLRGLVAGVSVALFAALIWLAIEIRRRRVLSAIVGFSLVTQADRRPTKPPASDATSTRS